MLMLFLNLIRRNEASNKIGDRVYVDKSTPGLVDLLAQHKIFRNTHVLKAKDGLMDQFNACFAAKGNTRARYIL